MAWLLIWGVVQGLTLLGVLAYLRYVPADRQQAHPAGAVLLLPVRAPWPGAQDFVAALMAQDAPCRLMIAAPPDAALMAELSELQHRYGDRLTILQVAPSRQEGQKIAKLRALLRELGPQDEWLVFLDADIMPPPRMVGRLLFPLERGKADIATGYRFQLPASGDPISALVAAVDMQVGTMPRPASGTLPWGGAMAMRRETAQALDLDAQWAGRLSDDLTVAHLARQRGLRVRPIRDLLVASPLDGGARAALAFARRQYQHLAANMPHLWWVAAAFVCVQSLGWAWAFLAGGWPAIAVGYVFGWARAVARGQVARRVLEPGQRSAARRAFIWDCAAPFLVTWAHALLLLAGGLTRRRIVWGGWRYDMRGGEVVSATPR